MLPFVIPDGPERRPASAPGARLTALFAPGAWHIAGAGGALLLVLVAIPELLRACGATTLDDCVLALGAAAISALPFCTCPRRAYAAKLVSFLLGIPAWAFAGLMCARYAVSLHR